MRRLVEEFQLSPEGHRLRPAADAQLAVDVADVALDGGNGDHQLPGNLLIGVPGGDKLQHFQFARAQRLDQALSGSLSCTGGLTQRRQESGEIALPIRCALAR